MSCSSGSLKCAENCAISSGREKNGTDDGSASLHMDRMAGKLPFTAINDLKVKLTTVDVDKNQGKEKQERKRWEKKIMRTHTPSIHGPTCQLVVRNHRIAAWCVWSSAIWHKQIVLQS